jgi:hypothetical protein
MYNNKMIANFDNVDYIEEYKIPMFLLKKVKKNNEFSEDIRLQINDRIIKSRNRDSRYSYKNRRIVNKDWKDFNNNQ